MKLLKLGMKLATLVVFTHQTAIGQTESYTGLSDLQTSQLNKLVDNAIDQYGIVGHTVIALKNGELAYSRSKGSVSTGFDDTVTKNTIYPIYSVTKLYVSAILLRLVENGKLNVSHPVSNYLTGLPKGWQSIKVTSLMAHSSGLPEFFDLSTKTSENPKKIIESLREKPFAFPTNSSVRYNQTNFLLLKLIIEKLYEKPLTSVIESEIIQPYGLSNTMFGGANVFIPGRSAHYYIRESGEISDIGVGNFATTMFAATGLNTSGADIAKWFEVLISGEFVKTETLLNAWQPLVLETGKTATYSHGWQVQQEARTTAVGHYGGNIINVRHFFINDEPTQSVTVLHLTNGGFYPSFSSFDFSYEIAKTMESELIMDTMEFKQRLNRLAGNSHMDQLEKEYVAFKRNPGTRQLNTEYLINDLGYQLLEKFPQASLRLFNLNTISYPESANAYDSYAEALYFVGEYAKSKINFKKAYDLDATYSHIPSMLLKIEKAMVNQPEAKQ